MGATLGTRIPSLKSLLAFEAAARTGSFSNAAKELNVTQPAVSRLVGRLEAHLGAKLLVRTSSGVVPTVLGEKLFQTVSVAFKSIGRQIDEITDQRSEQNRVTVSVSSAIATHWFLPKLADFYREFPKVDLKFQLADSEATGPLSGADLGVRLVADTPSNSCSTHIAREQILAVSSPGYQSEHGDLQTTVARHTLIHLNQPRFSWKQYLEQTETEYSPRFRSLTFSDYSLAIQAAIDGQGIALGWNLVVADKLLTAQLLPASPYRLTTGRNYYVTEDPDRPLGAVGKKVKRWMINQMKLDLASPDGGTG